MVRLRVCLRALVAGLALASSVLLGGCSQQQQSDVVQQEAQLAANATQSITFLQQQVALAQSVVSAYQTQLALLPPGDKSAASMQKSLAQAQGELVKAQLVLSLAKIGTEVLANVPAAQRVEQPATAPPGTPAANPQTPATSP